MTAKSYSVEYRRQGLAGGQEILARVYDVSTGDTISFGADFTRIDQAIILQRTNAPISLASVLTSGTGYTSRTVCLPAAASLAGDGIDLYVAGPAISSIS